jgi:hypothetical protein
MPVSDSFMQGISHCPNRAPSPVAPQNPDLASGIPCSMRITILCDPQFSFSVLMMQENAPGLCIAMVEAGMRGRNTKPPLHGEPEKTPAGRHEQFSTQICRSGLFCVSSRSTVDSRMGINHSLAP